MPVCERDEPDHRASTCHDCQQLYASARNHRRRKKRIAPCGMSLVTPEHCEGCGSNLRPGSASCHRCARPTARHPAACEECARLRRLRWWHGSGAARKRSIRRAARPANVVDLEDSDARARARVRAALRRARRDCECTYCSSQSVVLLVLPINGDDLFLFACEPHRAAGGKDLALAQLRMAEGDDPSPARLRSEARAASPRKAHTPVTPATMTSRYQHALTVIESLPAAVVQELRNRAMRFGPITLNEEAPLYRSQLTAFVERYEREHPG